METYCDTIQYRRECNAALHYTCYIDDEMCCSTITLKELFSTCNCSPTSQFKVVSPIFDVALFLPFFATADGVLLFCTASQKMEIKFLVQWSVRHGTLILRCAFCQKKNDVLITRNSKTNFPSNYSLAGLKLTTQTKTVSERCEYITDFYYGSCFFRTPLSGLHFPDKLLRTLFSKSPHLRSFVVHGFVYFSEKLSNNQTVMYDGKYLLLLSLIKTWMRHGDMLYASILARYCCFYRSTKQPRLHTLSKILHKLLHRFWRLMISKAIKIF